MTLLHLTLESFVDPPSRSQDPEFVRVSRSLTSRYPAETELLTKLIVRLATERGRPRHVPVKVLGKDGEPIWDTVVVGGVTAELVLAEAGGRQRYPRNLIGAVIGSMRRRHLILTDPKFRYRSTHPEAKGRFQNTYWINGDRIEVPKDTFEVGAE